MIDYGEFAQMLYATGVISDPWLNGKPRFSLTPVILSSELAAELAEAAECVAAIYDEVAEITLAHPELVDEFFGLTPWQKAMWLESGGRWHGIARVDLFLCADGRIRACEMNSDTPSGEAEAVLLNQVLHPFSAGALDPNVEFPDRFWEMLIASHQSRAPRSIAIIYPTDLPEDLSMIAIYKQWFETRGCRVVLGSPFNLVLDAKGRVIVTGEPIDLIVRHYKTDWWGERERVWSNQQDFADPDPLDRELLLLLEAESEGRVTVVNPFGAVVTQNKKAMALMWEHRGLFSPEAQGYIEEFIPETRRYTTLTHADLPRSKWVLKSDYGCEGDTVVCGPFVKPNDWQMALTAAIPEHWIAQRFFDVAPDENGMLPNYGVYLIGGSAAGFYTRISDKATNYTSLTVPTYIVEGGEWRVAS
jgi:glutathionylspermidine synthase